MSLVTKVRRYAEKFKEFDPEILEGVKLCYEYSPLFRAHVDSPYFGETLGWRISWLWTKNVKAYPQLKLIGPLDLGLYSVRIDSILGRTDLDAFVEEAKGKTIFQRYIIATAEFIDELLKRGDAAWFEKTPRRDRESIMEAVKLCREFSPTLGMVLGRGRGDGWDIVKIWVDEPDRITALREIYPLDIAIYCIRLDSITYGIDLKPLAEKMEEVPTFYLFPQEVVRFVNQILMEWI